MKGILCFFLLTSIANAQLGVAFLASLKPASGVTTLYTEGFEGTGYQVATSETGTNCDEDDTTFAIAGSQNLKITGGAEYAYPTAGWTPQTVITVKFAYKIDTVLLSTQILEIDATANATPRGYIFMEALGAVTIYGNGAGSVSSTTVDVLSAGTTYYFQSKWNTITGVYSIEFNTTGPNSFIGSGNKFATASDGATGVTIGGLDYYNTRAAYTAYFDQVSVTTP